MVIGLIAAMAVNIITNLYDGNRLPDMMLASIILVTVAALAIYTYLWIQRLMLDLSLKQIIKNSGCFPACLLGAASDSVSVFFRFPVLSRRMVSGIYDGADCVQHAG